MARTRKTLAALLAALGLAAAGAVAYSYQNDIRQARERVASGSRLVDTACGPIEYAEAGSGPAVLAVHGAGGGYDQGMMLGGDLAARGFRVIAPSRFGYLRTPLPPDASAEAQADAHACLLDALGIERAAVIGGSAGAPSSQQMAIRHPERVTALVLLVPAAYAPRETDLPSVQIPQGVELVFETALRSDFLMWAAIRAAPRLLIRSILATPPEIVQAAPVDEQQRVRRMLELILPVTQRRAGLLNDAAIVGSLRRYELERITAPTLALSAADDLYGTYEVARYTADVIPRARFKGFASGGHVWAGHHREIMDEIASFLNEALE